jgi:spoIIIJ-associated protein
MPVPDADGAHVSEPNDQTTDLDEAPEAAELETETETAGPTAAEGDTEGDTEGGTDTAVDEGAAEAADGTADSRSDARADLVREGDIAADYLEGLLDIADLDGDLDMDVEGDRAIVSIEGGDLGHLVGRNGEVLDALQELTRLAVLRETGGRSRLMLDIDGYRARVREELTELGTRAAEQVRTSGEPLALKAMNPFERKIVHDAVAAQGLVSESEGVEPSRYVVVRPS